MGLICPNQRIYFRTSRPDEDAPPVTSVNEMMSDIPPDSSQSRFQSRVGLTIAFACCGRADTSVELIYFLHLSSAGTTQISVCTLATICLTTTNSETPRPGLTTVVHYCFWLSARQVHCHVRILQVPRRRERDNRSNVSFTNNQLFQVGI